jgi:Sulfotransferase family
MASSTNPQLSAYDRVSGTDTRAADSLAKVCMSHRSQDDHGPGAGVTDALPNLVVIGAMKCGTSALHRYLDCHPDITMSQPKELNFFFGSDNADGQAWTRGNWHRGVAWYVAHFDARARVRGESSPGYTSPSHAEAAQRMATLVPAARLVYLVRDPVERAVSQYRHHRAERTEPRPLEQALLDPNSQYISRSRYYDRLAPFLNFDGWAITVVCLEELLAKRRSTLRTVFELLGVDGEYWSSTFDECRYTADAAPAHLDRRLHDCLAEALRDDADRLREFVGRDFPGWSL